MVSGSVFISYARADGKTFATEIYQSLKNVGLAPWIDKQGGIQPGTEWDREIENAIRDCSALILILTPGSIASKHCRDEWNYAFSHGKPVIPLQFIPCNDIPMSLNRIQYIDFTTLRHDTALQMLFDKLNIEADVDIEANVPVRIFISYKHRDEDEEVLAELKSYMEYDVQQAGGVFWYDEGIDWGENWHNVIKKQIQKADIALLLVSQRYLSSDYVNREEITDFLLKRQQEDTFLLLPLILEHCRWDVEERKWLKSTQAIPSDRDLPTVKAWRQANRQDELYRQITDSIIEHVKDIKGKKQEAIRRQALKRRKKTTRRHKDDIQLREIMTSLNVRPSYPRWCIIPGGEAFLGDNSLTNTTEYTASLDTFLMSETPVTQEQYQQFLLSTNHPIPSNEEFFPDYSWTQEGRLPQYPSDKKNHPVVLVSANDATSYCKWLQKQLYQLSNLEYTWQVMLPSEVEWEYAARGRSGQSFPWGPGAPTKDLCNVDRAYGGTTSVYQFRDVDKNDDIKSPFGLREMIGNIWEWTRSYLDDSDNSMRVLKGGSWQTGDIPHTLRPAYRHSERENLRHHTIGFRVVIVRI